MVSDMDAMPDKAEHELSAYVSETDETAWDFSKYFSGEAKTDENSGFTGENAIVRPWRHELKYLISDSEVYVLNRRFSQLLSLDSHATGNKYFIRSLYFDDEKGTALNDKTAGTFYRKKYRIRIYNLSDNVIMLERKRKEGTYIQKTSTGLSRIELENILSGNYSFLLNRNDRLCREFYIELVSKRLHPVIIVDYDRIPYVYKYGDVRLTFDYNLKATAACGNMFDLEEPSFDVLEPGTQILEVKYTEYLPDIIRDLLKVDASIQVSASKYVMCLEKRKDISSRRNFSEG